MRQEREQPTRQTRPTPVPRHMALMQDALQRGWNSRKVAQALKARIRRDESYLAYRRRSGYRTATDEAIQADLYALAWAVCYLEEGIRDGGNAESVGPQPQNERGRMPSE